VERLWGHERVGGNVGSSNRRAPGDLRSDSLCRTQVQVASKSEALPSSLNWKCPCWHDSVTITDTGARRWRQKACTWCRGGGGRRVDRGGWGTVPGGIQLHLPQCYPRARVHIRVEGHPDNIQPSVRRGTHVCGVCVCACVRVAPALLCQSHLETETSRHISHTASITPCILCAATVRTMPNRAAA
jgi:hypothetical protein